MAAFPYNSPKDQWLDHRVVASSATAVSSDVPESVRAFQQLEDEIASLGSAADSLLARLGPALRPLQENGAIDRDGGPRPLPPFSDITNRIDKIRLSVSVIAGLIRSANDRLEL